MSVYDDLGEELAELQGMIAKDYGCNPVLVSKRTTTEFVDIEIGAVMMILTGWEWEE